MGLGEKEAGAGGCVCITRLTTCNLGRQQKQLVYDQTLFESEVTL